MNDPQILFAPFTSLPILAIAILAIIAAVAGVGRLARIITYDDFPPAVWWRTRWSGWTKDGPWAKLFTCYWCLSPWLMLIAILWYWWGLENIYVGVAWWAFWGWLALSYLAAILVNHDERD